MFAGRFAGGQALEPRLLTMSDSPIICQVATPHGPARLHLHLPPDAPVGLLLLGHGAGGAIATGDLQVAAQVAFAAGFATVLMEQPYRVAGRKAPAPAHQVDAAWTAVAEQLTDPGAEFSGLPLVTGGRSFGARVACRTWQATGSVAVLCLAFPVHPPGRPEKSRQAELSAVGVATLVVQGEQDPFGMPESSPNGTVVVVAGNHTLKKDPPAVRKAIAAWLPNFAGR